MKRSLREFTKNSWEAIEPGREFQDNWHIDAISDHLQAVVEGDIKRLIINVPPRHMKSISVAVALPAWAWTIQPSKQFLYASYASSLSIRDSVKCRRLIDSRWYQNHFGETFKLTGDQNQKQRFENDKTGYRIATSVGGALTGDGGDIVVIDDPHNSIEADSSAVREGVLEWWDQSMQTRLNNPKTGAFIIIMQRLHEQDLTGHILANELGDEWDHLMLPARYEIGHPTPMRSTLNFTDPRTKEGELLWPNRIDEKTLKTLERSLGSYAAAGQLQQRPMPKGGGILKAEWWVPWEHAELPDIEYVLQSWDTAFSTKEKSSYSARTTWGVFKMNGQINAIVLEMWYDRVSYPELRKLAQEAYNDWEPDAVLIEKKASGQSLLQDLRMAGVPVLEYMPDRDKQARAHASSALLEDGRIFFPKDKMWAKNLIDICAAFPATDNDDIVDTCTQAWLRLRKGWFVTHSNDFDDDDYEDKRRITLYG
jgi:predicted phage terminase large subunit-like protein|tara:strand:+ start:1332 stop:2774 length:1443 start_codon:yes stop_codon:yes gene_type:complete